jgi:hypothetical protein
VLRLAEDKDGAAAATENHSVTVCTAMLFVCRWWCCWQPGS